MKLYLGVVLAIVGCVVAVIGGRMYYSQHYLPIRAVQMIVRLLDEGTRDSVNRGAMLVTGRTVVRYPDGTEGMESDPNRPKIVGEGAKKVKQSLLRAMEKETDPVTLRCLLICVGTSAEEGTIVFRDEKEWTIIAAAAKRQNADPLQPVHFFVTKDTNGVTVLGLGSTLAIP
ncbi:MAG: hypothetical protein FJ222_06560 [Lentisphaerae bacterium]|nr:hypothetical protein [Lentisphaerota bacterium]